MLVCFAFLFDQITPRMSLVICRLECPAGNLPPPPTAEKDWLETFATQRKPLPLYPPIRMLHVWLVFVHARVFTITADSNASRYWLSTNSFATE